VGHLSTPISEHDPQLRCSSLHIATVDPAA
jgi:hypothetical protein